MALSVERTGNKVRKAVLRSTDGFTEPNEDVHAVIRELFTCSKLKVAHLVGFLSEPECERLTAAASPLMRHARNTALRGSRRMTDVTQAGSSRALHGQGYFAQYSQDRLWGNDHQLEEIGERFGTPHRVHALLADATSLEHRAARERSLALNTMVFRNINSADLHTDDIRTRADADSELQHIVAQCSWNLFFCVTAKGGCTNVYGGGVGTPVAEFSFLEDVCVRPQTGDLVIMNTSALHEVEGVYDGLRLSASGMVGVHEQAGERRLLSWT